MLEGKSQSHGGSPAVKICRWTSSNEKNRGVLALGTRRVTFHTPRLGRCCHCSLSRKNLLNLPQLFGCTFRLQALFGQGLASTVLQLLEEQLQAVMTIQHGRKESFGCNLCQSTFNRLESIGNFAASYAAHGIMSIVFQVLTTSTFLIVTPQARLCFECPTTPVDSP